MALYRQATPSELKDVANIESVANKALPNVANKNRYADKDKRREYMRAYMAKRRASHA